VEFDGKLPGPDLAAQITSRDPGTSVRLKLRRGKTVFPVRLALESKPTDIYKLEDLPNLTIAQRARRTAWLSSEDESAGTAANPGPEVGNAETSVY
jgi:hypothetical protein